MNFKKSLKLKIILTAIILIISPLILTGVINHINMTNDYQIRLIDEGIKASENISDQVENSPHT